MMRGEILAIGDELTSGRILNTTSSLAAARLLAAGHKVTAMTTVGDNPDDIGIMLKHAMARSQFVIITGGLGATTDDLTNEAVAKALDIETSLNQDLMESILRQHVPECRRSTDTPDGMLERLAMLPTGSKVLKPAGGMAGHLLVHNGILLFFLPGVPHEMEELLDDCVIPDLAVRNTGKQTVIRQELYRVFDLAETDINIKCDAVEKAFPSLHLGYYPVFPEVHVSLFLAMDNKAAADQVFHTADQAIRRALGQHIYGTGQQSMAETVGILLKEKHYTLSVAESCTGGRLAGLLTAVSGSSEFFSGGVVAYANEVKEYILGVKPEILAEYGAASSNTAKAMAEGAREKMGTDIAVSITGIAGPSGGTPEKPVGTVFFGLALPDGTREFLFHFQKNRWQIQAMAAQKALDLVRLYLLETTCNKNI